MTTKTKAAWHRCNDNHAKAHALGRSNQSIPDYEIGSLVFGVIFAIAFGLMFVHAAVVL